MTEPTTEALDTVRARIAALGREATCNDMVRAAAQKIVEREQGGSHQAVYAVLPQLADDVRKGAQAGLDLNGDGAVGENELQAAVIAASQIARRTGVKLEDVPMADILKLSPAICEQISKTTRNCKPTQRGTK